MADISKCEGLDCPKRESCYRYTAPANEYTQSYIIPLFQDGEECPEYWPTPTPSED